MMKKYFMLGFCSIILFMQSCYFDNKEDLFQYLDSSCNFIEVSYQNDVLPVLQSDCISCHNQNDPQGNVDLEGYTAVKIHADNGSLYGSIAHEVNYSVMPPSGQKINACAIEKIKAWVEAGAENN